MVMKNEKEKNYQQKKIIDKFESTSEVTNYHKIVMEKKLYEISMIRH